MHKVAFKCDHCAHTYMYVCVTVSPFGIARGMHPTKFLTVFCRHVIPAVHFFFELCRGGMELVDVASSYLVGVVFYHGFGILSCFVAGNNIVYLFIQ